MDKIEKLIVKAGKMTDETRKNVEKVRESCDACGIFTNRKLKPPVSLPKATKKLKNPYRNPCEAIPLIFPLFLLKIHIRYTLILHHIT